MRWSASEVRAEYAIRRPVDGVWLRETCGLFRSADVVASAPPIPPTGAGHLHLDPVSAAAGVEFREAHQGRCQLSDWWRRRK